MKIKIDRKSLALLSMLVICVIVAVYADVIGDTAITYALFFFIPIILAAMWYYRYAVFVAAFLGIVNILVETYPSFYFRVNEFLRFVFFIFVAYIIGLVNEKRAKEMEKTKTAKRQIETIINSSNDLISYKDENLRYLIANRAYENFYNVRVRDIIGKTDFDFMPKEVAKLLKESDEAALKSKGPFEKEESIGDHYFYTVKQSVWDEKGNIIGIVSVTRDITERRQIEEEMRKLSTAIEQAADSIFITDKNGIIEYLNPALEKLSGYSKNEVIGKTPSILKSGKHDQQFYENLWNTILSGKVYYGEMINRKKNGEFYYIERTITPIKDSKGNITHFVSIGMDVTKCKYLETELKKYTEHLEEEVKQRTQELLQSEKMAAVGVLVAGVAHEINNPLSYIKTNAEFLKEDLNDLKSDYQATGKDQKMVDGLIKMTDTINEGINRIAHITQALKRFAKPDAGEKVPSDINQGIRDTLLILQNQLKHRVKVNEVYGDIPNINCNINQLNQVFMNIILNSSQAMDEGEIWIRTSSDTRYVYVEIRDNGKGIQKEHLNKIFDPFFTTKRTGTGLGLSTSYKIIKEHKGSITVESEVGVGTKMTITLPIEG